MQHRVGAAVVGAGVVGLAVARKLARCGIDVLVLEAAPCIGTVTSSRNSEVVHAGIYYREGSLKARCCVEGRRLLYSFCDDHNVQYKRCGKLLVATNEAQHEALDSIQRRAIANGLVGSAEALVNLSAAEAMALEPELVCTGALFSPSTGVIDSHSFMVSLQGAAENAGAVFAFNTPVVGGCALPEGGALLRTGDDSSTELRCDFFVNCAGLAAPALAARIHQYPSAAPAARFAKGNYYKLQGVQAPFSRLVYPVPEADGSGLGVHTTIDLGGQARFGPDVEWLPDPEPESCPEGNAATSSIAAAPPSMPEDYGVDPRRAASFYEAVRRYWPALPDGALVPDYAGIRPKLRRMSSDEEDDFLLWGEEQHGAPRVLHLLGIESPGLTSALALAEHAAERLEVAPRTSEAQEPVPDSLSY